MKNWKKLASLLLAAVTALGMNAAALAAEADAGKMRESDKKRHSPWGTVPLSCN